MSDRHSARRLVEIDALRGIAALAVVLFHYTTRFHQLFPGMPELPVAFPRGSLGVNLFFVISGFVIFMTLERTKQALDFVISRFSRLYPAYWLAVALTFGIATMLGLPGKTVTLTDAVANLTMIHGFFRIPHVDGVYWTLEVELLFYCGMFFLYKIKRLNCIFPVLWGLLLMRLIYFVAARDLGIDLSWTLSRILILEYIGWFAIGVSIYQLTKSAAYGDSRPAMATIVGAVATLAIVHTVLHGVLAITLGLLVYLAATGRLSVLRFPVLVWLGSISYPLYLIHENIGWSVMLQLYSHGWGALSTFVTVMALALSLATLISLSVEKPAMRAIRTWYASRSPRI